MTTTATCGDVNPYTRQPCALPAGHPGFHTTAKLLALSADGCGCWSRDCAACMRRMHDGQRPTAKALQRSART